MTVMMRSPEWRRRFAIAWLPMGIAGLVFLAPDAARAHCDGLDGPVVNAAREAIKTGDVNRVLIWVRAKDETEIRSAFQRTVAVRKLSPEAKDLADTYFFETLVRVHRAGEGAPYSGLKPAGRDLGPAIPAADRALETGDAGPLTKLLAEVLERGVHERFRHALQAQVYGKDDLAAGREVVEAYVAFIHYVVRLFEASTHPAEDHYPEAPAPAERHE